MISLAFSALIMIFLKKLSRLHFTVPSFYTNLFGIFGFGLFREMDGSSMTLGSMTLKIQILIFLAAVASSFNQIFRFMSLKYGEVSNVVLFIPIRLAFQFLYETFVLGQDFVVYQIFGVMCMIFSLVLLAFLPEKKKKEHEEVNDNIQLANFI